jgi:phosphodiesterase/alkaline phosphatase D-like protein
MILPHPVPFVFRLIVLATLLGLSGQVIVRAGDVRLERDTPQVWNVSASQATVAWFTAGEPAEAYLEYGLTTDYGTRLPATSRDWSLLTGGGPMQRHVATLAGLKPDTQYFYRLIAGKTPIVPTANTAPADYHFLTIDRFRLEKPQESVVKP